MQAGRQREACTEQPTNKRKINKLFHANLGEKHAQCVGEEKEEEREKKVQEMKNH